MKMITLTFIDLRYYISLFQRTTFRISFPPRPCENSAVGICHNRNYKISVKGSSFNYLRSYSLRHVGIVNNNVYPNAGRACRRTQRCEYTGWGPLSAAGATCAPNSPLKGVLYCILGARGAAANGCALERPLLSGILSGNLVIYLPPRTRGSTLYFCIFALEFTHLYIDGSFI